MKKIQLYFSIIFLFLSTFYFIYKFTTYYDYLESKIENYLEQIDYEIDTSHKLSSSFIEKITPNLFYAISYAEDRNSDNWQLILYLNSYSGELENLEQKNSYFTGILENRENKYAYKVVYNKLNPTIVINFFIIELVVIILVYLISVVILRLAFAGWYVQYPKRETDQPVTPTKEPTGNSGFATHEPLKYDLTSEEIDALLKEED